jgi:hypothetical protein
MLPRVGGDAVLAQPGADARDRDRASRRRRPPQPRASSGYPKSPEGVPLRMRVDREMLPVSAAGASRAREPNPPRHLAHWLHSPPTHTPNRPERPARRAGRAAGRYGPPVVKRCCRRNLSAAGDRSSAVRRSLPPHDAQSDQEQDPADQNWPPRPRRARNRKNQRRDAKDNNRTDRQPVPSHAILHSVGVTRSWPEYAPIPQGRKACPPTASLVWIGGVPIR